MIMAFGVASGGGGFFDVFPLEGVIPPYTHQRCVVEFRPLYERRYKAECRLDVEGCIDDLVVELSAEGRAPEVTFNRRCIDVGNVLVHQPCLFEANLNNGGAVEAHYDIRPPSDVSNWKCHPHGGKISPRSDQTLRMALTPTILGAFSHTVEWKLHGSATRRTFEVRGVACAPGFQLLPHHLHFATVPIGFPCVQTMDLTNTSAVSFDFALQHDRADLLLRPSRGRLHSGDRTCIDVTWTPMDATTTTLDETMAFRMIGLDQILTTVTLKGDADRPRLKWQTPVIDLGKCFIGHPCRLRARLINTSDGLQASYTLEPPSLDFANIRPLHASPLLPPEVRSVDVTDVTSGGAAGRMRRRCRRDADGAWPQASASGADDVWSARPAPRGALRLRWTDAASGVK